MYHKNAAGYQDPTAGTAMYNADTDKRRANELIRVLRYIIDKSGFEVSGRICLRDKKTGSVYK